MSKLQITFPNLLGDIVEINSPKIDIDLIGSWLFILMSIKTFLSNISNIMNVMKMFQFSLDPSILNVVWCPQNMIISLMI